MKRPFFSHIACLSAALLLAALPAKAEPSLEGPGCPLDFARLGNGDALARWEEARGKPFTSKQRAAIEKADALVPGPAYSASQIAKQEKILRAAKLKPKEIEDLRRHHVITNSRAELIGQVPESAKVVELGLRPIDAATLTGKKEFRYIVDSENNLFLVDDKIDLTPDTLWLVQNRNSGAEAHHLVKESGLLKSDGPRLEFHPSHSLDTTREELEARIAKLEEAQPSLKVSREIIERQNQAKVLHCADMLAKSTSTKRALLDRLIADNLVMASAMGVSELGGAHRFSSSDGRQVVIADVIGNNINSVIGAYIGKYLVATKRSLPISLLTRTAVAMGMIEVQKNVYKQVLDKDPEERAGKIAAFDRYYFMGKLPISHYTDRFIMQRLPEMLFEACRNDNQAALYFSPGRVRIAERYASTILYYGMRSAIVSE